MPQAIPIVIAAAATASTAAGAAGLGVFGVGVFGTSLTVGAVVGAALSIAASVAGILLQKAPDAGEQSIEALTPRVSAKPPKRIAVGRYKFGGRLFMNKTDDRNLYQTYSIASHPIALGAYTLYVDDQETTGFDASPVNLTSGTPPLISSPRVLTKTACYIADGTHTQAPQLWVNDGIVDTTDRWDGLTMLFVLSVGASAEDFNKVYPRGANRELQLLCDGGKWPHPTTGVEEFTRTPARIAYGLMRSELGLNLSADEIDGDSFLAGALIEEQPRALAGGGSEPFFRMDGPLDLTTDRGDFIAKVENTAASQIVLQGGRWAYLPGVARQSVMTLDQGSIVGPPSLSNGSADKRYNTVQGSFIDPALYTVGTLPWYQNPTTLARDGKERFMQPQYSHVVSHVQAQHLDRIALNLSRRQKSISGMFGGRARFLTKGDVVTTNFGLPFWTDGNAIVISTKEEIVADDGNPRVVVNMELKEYDPTDYDFGVGDQQPYTSPTSSIVDIPAHTAVAVPIPTFSGSGNTRSVEITIQTTREAYSIEWAYSLNAGTDWIDRPEVVVDSTGTVSAVSVLLRQEGLPSGTTVQWRFRAKGGTKLTGEWAETVEYTVPGAQALPTAPGSVTATTVDSITTEWLVPNDTRIDQIEIYRGTDQTEPDPNQAARVELDPTTPGTTYTLTDTGLTPDTYRYWSRVYDGGNAGPWSNPVDQTV